MLFVYLILFILTLLATIALFFIDNDGSVVMEWMGYNIQTSMGVMVLATLVTVVVLSMVFQAVLWVVRAPGRLGKHHKDKRREAGLTALTKGFAAVYEGDVKQASKLSKQVVSTLGDIPLTKLLQARIAQLQDDRQTARLHYTAMLEDKETEMVAIKALLLEAREDGDLHKAVHLAERALSIKPNADWALSILIDLYKRLNEWSKSQSMVEKAVKRKVMPAAEGKRSIALLYLARAVDAVNDGKHDIALAEAKKAFKLNHEFTPIVTTYAHVLIQEGKNKKAISILEQGWKAHPHPDIVKLYVKLFETDSASKRLQRVEKLVDYSPESLEGHMAVARIALDNHETNKARNHLKIALGIAETQGVCRLMAKLEEVDEGTTDTIRQWKNRAENALPDAQWNCRFCGFSGIHWHVNCPNCGAFDGLRWNSPIADYDVLRPHIALASDEYKAQSAKSVPH